MLNHRRAVASVVAAAAAGACGSDASDEGLVARVSAHRLTVDEAVELLVDQENLAAQVQVVETLADLWIDYTLLAEAVARDSTFPSLDLEPIVMQQVSQAMVFQLRDSVIQVDTFVTDAELRARYEAEEPALEIRARHIMLQLPLQANVAQRDSVTALLGDLRSRILAGESFEALAREYSQDPGSAANGGDLGYFGRGDMVAPFEEAALALEPGETSAVVTTPMGLHLIRLEDRRVQDFDRVAVQYRRQIQTRMVQEAESVFVAGLLDRVGPSVTEGAVDVLREVAANPGSTLSGRAERRALVEWDGGSVAVRDARRLVRMESPAFRRQIEQSEEGALESFLMSLARRELLVQSAEEAGLRPGRDSLDVLVEGARAQLRSAARALGLMELDRAPGEALEPAVGRAVEAALTNVLTGATPVVPLGLVAFQLREGRAATVLEAGVGEVILRVAEIRSERQLSPVEGALVDSAAAPGGGSGR